MNIAALQNLDPHWFQVFEKLGLHVVLVAFDAALPSPIHRQPNTNKEIGESLKRAGLGYLDSTAYPSGAHWNFYHVNNLGDGMTFLKARLEARDLLGITNILHAEESNQLRIWYSHDPDCIGKLIEG